MANIIEIHDFSDPALDVYTRIHSGTISALLCLASQDFFYCSVGIKYHPQEKSDE